MRLRQKGLVIGLCGWLLVALPLQAADTPQPLLVFGAVSLTDVLTELGAAYEKESQQQVKFSFAASSVLARQIEAGAHADVFFSADAEWMDYLQARKLIDKNSRRDVLSNRLVLIAPSTSTLELKITPNFALMAALGARGRLSTGDPDSVPAGRYARSALSLLGVWNEVAGRLVRADNVRTALAFVARGEAPLGIVYETDAKVDSKVRIVDVFPADSHLPIVYPVAAAPGAKPGAARFMGYLHSAAAASTFQKYGFAVLH